MRKGMCLTRNRYPFSAGITVQFHPKYAYVALSESNLYQQGFLREFDAWKPNSIL